MQGILAVIIILRWKTSLSLTVTITQQSLTFKIRLSQGHTAEKDMENMEENSMKAERNSKGTTLNFTVSSFSFFS